MTTKPPSALAAGDAPNPDKEDDDLLVDASDDITVEANEEVTTEAATAGLSSVPSETPLPSADAPAESTPMTRSAAPTLLGIPLSSIPLPGVIAAASQPSIIIAEEDGSDEEEVTRLARPINDEVTRPSITEEDEEETKVEATDPLMRLDDGTDDVATALAEQASVEREKALRRSSPSFPASALPPSGDSGIEFADPDDDAVMGDDAIDEEAPDDATANYADSAPETSPLAAAITRRPPPGAPFGRLPAPTPSLGLSLSPAPVGQVPAPSSSPFGSRLTATTGATPFGGRTTTSSAPAVQIPAPSAGAPIAARTPLLYKKYSIPLVGLVAMQVVMLIVGLAIGGVLSSGSAPVVAVTPPPTPAPTTAPLVHPIAVTPPPAQTAPEPTIAEPPPAEPEAKAVVKRIIPRPRKVEPLPGEEQQALAPRAARPAPKPAPPAAKPVVVKKPTKPWVDPFAN